MRHNLHLPLSTDEARMQIVTMPEVMEHHVSETCSSCHSIDWSPLLEVLRQPLPETGHFLRLLGRTGNTKNSLLVPRCPICTSLKSITPKLASRYQLQARLYDLDEHGFMSAVDRKRLTRASKNNTLNSRVPGDCQPSALQLQVPAIVVLRHNSKYTYAKGKASEAGERGLMVGAVDPVSHPVQPVDRETVNYDILRTFLDRCEKQHNTQPSEALPVPAHLSELYVIDVDTMSIKALPTSATFIALSYVWGEQGQDKNVVRRSRKEFQEGLLVEESSLPLTIRDAILATKMLRRRYLWVDRYCINFTNHSHQSAMINNMDKIYAGAELTIVALSGQSADAGLPGVSSVFRNQQPQFTAAELTWRSTLPNLKALIRDSTWSRRGWTYQEARLSRVCLFFTDQQVYCVCKHSCISESLPFESEVCGLASMFNNNCLNEGLLNTSDARNFHFNDRFAYTQRTLSFEADILNAFSGLLNRQGFLHISGQPVTAFGSNLPACTGFAMGLLWSSWKSRIKSTIIAYSTKETAPIRRSGFPSWSWSSVNGTIVSDHSGGTSIFYQQFMNGSTDFQSYPPLTTHFYIPEREGEPCVDLCRARDLHQTTGPKNVNFDKLVVEGDIVKVRLFRDSYWSNRIEKFICCDKEGTLTPYAECKLPKYESMYYRQVALDLPETCLGPRNFMKLTDEAIPSEHLDTIAQALRQERLAIQDMQRWSISKEVDDALVLIDWRTDTPEGGTRWVLMLLKWLDDNTAERVEILGRYEMMQDTTYIDKIPRQRKRFTLV